MNRSNIPDFIGVDPLTDTAYLTYDRGDDLSLCVTIVDAIAAISNRPPLDVEPIHSVVDPDSLEAIFEPVADDNPRDQGTVSFRIEGFRVVVFASGTITIDFSDADL